MLIKNVFFKYNYTHIWPLLGISDLRGWDEDPINKFDTQLISNNVDHHNSRHPHTCLCITQ